MGYNADFMEEYCGVCGRGTKGEDSPCMLCGSTDTITYNTREQSERQVRETWKRRYS